jgi:hypothetical protein
VKETTGGTQVTTGTTQACRPASLQWRLQGLATPPACIPVLPPYASMHDSSLAYGWRQRPLTAR